MFNSNDKGMLSNQVRLDTGSTKRLVEFVHRLTTDSDKVVYDDRAVEVALKYAKNPQIILAELEYLRYLTDTDGVRFGRSIKHYVDMEEVWRSFLSPEPDSYMWNYFAKAALIRVCERYSRAKLMPLVYQSSDDIINAITDWTTSSGWEYILSGRRHKVDILSDNIASEVDALIQQAKVDGTFDKPILPGVRTQCSGAYAHDGSRTNTCKHKTRPINMVDVFVIIIERMYAKPLTEWIKDYSFSAIGKTDEWISNWVFDKRAKGWDYISLDYSKYDSTIPSWLIHSAFQVIKCAFNQCDETLLKVIEHDFIHKVLVTGEGMLEAHHGNPSGSAFTAIVNGICNEIMTETWLLKYGVSNACYNIMGDDNLIYLGQSATSDFVEEVCSFIQHNFGIVTNASKAEYGTSNEYPEYLSRKWTPNGGWRPLGEIISLMAYPETFRKYNSKESQLTPEMIFYSYILAYPAAMREHFNVGQFLLDTNFDLDSIAWTLEQRKSIPYNLRTYLEATGHYS